MSTLRIRLPDDIDLGLTREAELTHRAESEIARDAIVVYLKRQEGEPPIIVLP